MDSENKEKIYCDDDGEYGIYCHVSDKLAIDRLYNIHLKSQTQKNNIRKRQQLNNTNYSILPQYSCYKKHQIIYPFPRFTFSLVYITSFIIE